MRHERELSIQSIVPIEAGSEHVSPIRTSRTIRFEGFFRGHFMGHSYLLASSAT